MTDEPWTVCALCGARLAATDAGLLRDAADALWLHMPAVHPREWATRERQRIGREVLYAL